MASKLYTIVNRRSLVQVWLKLGNLLLFFLYFWHCFVFWIEIWTAIVNFHELLKSNVSSECTYTQCGMIILLLVDSDMHSSYAGDFRYSNISINVATKWRFLQWIELINDSDCVALSPMHMRYHFDRLKELRIFNHTSNLVMDSETLLAIKVHYPM